MASSADRSDLRPREVADLSALADGSLDPARREQVEAQIRASAELSAMYERERRVVGLLHQTRAERAPERLRARIEAARPSRPVRARRRTTYAGGLAAALAVLVLALVLVLPSGTPGGPSISQAAALAGLGASAPAPVPDPDAPGVKLGAKVGRVYFPNWTKRFGWRAIGERTDVIGGRTSTTVFYKDWHGKRLAYTIVGAPALAAPSARVTELHGTVLRTLTLHGRLVVTWRRSGHTCVLSGQGVPPPVLQQLAAWRAADAG